MDDISLSGPLGTNIASSNPTGKITRLTKGHFYTL